MKILKNIGLLLLSLIAAYLLSPFVGGWYEKIFRDYSGWVSLSPIIGLPLAYIFFLTLIFTAFGGEKKYWWIGILLIPTVAFELYFDLAHIYFPIILGLLGWGIGYGISKLMKK